jgi:uncharacterized protein
MLVLPLVLNGLGVTHLALPAGWHALGALGPVTAALLVAGPTQGRPGVTSLLASMRRWRVGWVWWAVGLGSPVVILGLGVVLIGFWSNQWLDFSQVVASSSALTFWLIDGVLIGILYGVGEEPGWRGFALRRLWNGLVSTLLLFVMWAVFHTPFFFYRSTFGPGSLVGFLIGLLAGAFWLTVRGFSPPQAAGLHPKR